MIKTGTNDIPSIYVGTITEKQSKDDFLADLNKVRKEHAQSVNQNYSVTESIPTPVENVKQKSLRDSNGSTLSKQQAEYVKKSKIRDEDGNLLVVYHGTDTVFTVFDSGNEDIRWSIREDIVGSNGNHYGKGVYLDSDLLSNLTEEERIELIKLYVQERRGESFDTIDGNGNAVSIRIAKGHERFVNQSGKRKEVNNHMLTEFDILYSITQENTEKESKKKKMLVFRPQKVGKSHLSVHLLKLQ